MKKLFFTMMSILIANSASAKALTIESLKELCVLEENPEISQSFDENVSYDIKQTESLSDFMLKLVNVHLMHEQYTDKALSFAEVKALFSDSGDQGYNDLYITAFGSKSTGNLYVIVKSYPGDNPYALIFNAYDGKVVASVADDSITLKSGKRTVNCTNLESNH